MCVAAMGRHRPKMPLENLKIKGSRNSAVELLCTETNAVRQPVPESGPEQIHIASHMSPRPVFFVYLFVYA